MFAGVRVEPNVPSATHAEPVTAFHAKSGLDSNRREETCRRILAMPYVHLRGFCICIRGRSGAGVRALRKSD